MFDDFLGFLADRLMRQTEPGIGEGIQVEPIKLLLKLCAHYRGQSLISKHYSSRIHAHVCVAPSPGPPMAYHRSPADVRRSPQTCIQNPVVEEGRQTPAHAADPVFVSNGSVAALPAWHGPAGQSNSRDRGRDRGLPAGLKHRNTITFLITG